MAVYFIADTHFGHTNILRYRPQFSTIEEHDAIITENILSVCGKRDTLYILGDAFIGPQSFGQLRLLSAKIEFVHIVLGNHCLERKGSPDLDTLLKYCKSITAMKPYKRAWLTHAPIHPQELRGRVNIHGHVHSNVLTDDRYICVSCEAVDYTPVNLAGRI